MPRIHNFSAGPAVLPESVVRQLADDLWDLKGSGLGLVECSHRSALFDEIVHSARERLHRLLRLDDDQVVLFLHGGARTQFWQWPANILRGGRAAYIDTGTWSAGAAANARLYGTVDTVWSSQDTHWDHVPTPGAWGALAPDTLYLHYTSNNTVAGTEFGYVPESGEALLVCDMSSDILSRPLDGHRFDFIYAGAQKNLGPSGVTLAIVRRSLLDRMDPNLPPMVRYGRQVEKESMLNTPSTFAIYGVERVCAWIEERGGVEAMEARNVRQADQVYQAIDGSSLFKGKVQEGSRSRMNITFTTGNPELDTLFWTRGQERGLAGLKGHRSVGGLRASVYNAQTDRAVEALVDYMRTFEREVNQ